ncbi:phage major capsid protein [Rhodococcus sp. P1Y]|uniref:phage major capsid protein n=1 Tax=Rhodococcus sp. P1Y TaxID=1302308 RepID=UPI000EB3768C|nr:phage major capsid protein [Rhodococcus sp. P1Y]AYJ48996.1 phage major capsid protein [Rhodococcus sp. P1Y]
MSRRRKNTATAGNNNGAADTLGLRGLNGDAAESRREELRSELANLVHENETRGELDENESSRWDELTEGIEFLDDQAERFAEAVALVHGGHSEDSSKRTHGPSTRTAPTERDAVLRNLDGDVKAKNMTEDAAGTVEKLLGGDEGRSVTRWARAVGDPAYRTAFAKLAVDPDRGHLEWTAAEADAYRAVQTVSRALNEGTGSQGGHLVPLSLDPSIILTSGGSVNPIREIARNVTITGQAWRGVSSAGVTAEWTPEATEMADASPTLANPVIPVYKQDAFIPFSWEVEQDSAGDFLAELQALLADGLEQLTATALTTGTGTNQPRGVVTALLAAGAPYILTPGTPEVVSAADIFRLQSALPPRFQPNAQWAVNLGNLNVLRQFETGNGALKFPELADGRLLNRKINEVSSLDDINPAVTDTANVVVVYGDWSNYVVVNRIGTTLEFIQNLVGPSRRPTGQRGAVMYARVGGDVVNPNGFRALNVATTA